MFQFLKKDSKKEVHVNEIDNLLGTIELIDIREPYEYAAASIKGAKNIPMGEILEKKDKFLTKDKTYYIMCQSGGRSRHACSILEKQGYDVINVAGGMGSYSGKNRK
ncbi:rhodanese-like domain-containing protein [Anaeromicropila populeti]|uniref:Rhodanese-related sulfurtransferase n=1 Tax=Anaeromicropila populeti TaxID=37658 RepID=A0A1I6KME3_9FIRM|nr:rhodanese-like domain-containing protein [Anaeromicropila populeti]SFR92432.1 Rhodanese-related sulfurtransferase [Anaeromicropila populeti]